MNGAVHVDQRTSLPRLAGKIAVVTGAASGIGHATTCLFAEEGATVIAVDRSESPIRTVFEGRSGIFPVVQDVTLKGAAKAIVETTLQECHGLDILFNNAGVSDHTPVEAVSDEMWERAFAVNTRAVFELCREAVPHLRRRAEQIGRARIINTASVMAERTDFGLSAYTASKHAVAGLSKALALELGKWSITVNYILPGAIYTGMTKANFEQDHIREVWAKKAALRRLGMPIDIARAVLLLASDDSDFITGHGLVVDGGLTLRV